jgi:hypothetical protein
MLIALTKLADIAVRSMFVLLVLYALPVRETGQFGLGLTLLGVYAFAAGFERYNDLQRRLAGTGAHDSDRLIISSLRFFTLNHLVGLPLLALLLVWWVKLPLALVLAAAVVGVSEQFCNEVYRIALIAPRYRPLLFTVLGKNALLLAIVVAQWWQNERTLRIDGVLLAWAGCSLAGLLMIAAGAMRLWTFVHWADVVGAGLTQRQQWRASATHFLIGLVAMATLQLDRLIAGGLLSLDESGRYFRHAFLASFAYQVFNVASYNRLAPRIYTDCRSNHPAQARSAIRQEYQWLVPSAVLVMAGFYAAVHLGAGVVPALQSVNPHLLALLTAGYFVRTIADFNALLLNAVMSERMVFNAQLAALAATLLFNLTLTPVLGLTGPMLSLGLTAVVYALATRHFVRRNRALTSPSPT